MMSLCTEEDAKERWCPFVRQSDDHHSYNRWGADGICRCIASQCMAWRFADWSKSETGSNELPLRGYCGLAGKP